MKNFGIYLVLLPSLLTLATGQFTTKTLKCTQSSARGVKAESIFEYERNNERVGDRIISLCAIKESIVVDGDLNLGTRRLSEIDCDWIPSCYKEATKKSDPIKFSPTPIQPTNRVPKAIDSGRNNHNQKTTGPTLYKPPTEQKTTGPTLYTPSSKPAAAPVVHTVKSTGPTLYTPSSKPTASVISTGPTLYTHSSKPLAPVRNTGPTLYTPDPRTNRPTQYTPASKPSGPTLYTPTSGPILGPTLYTPSAKTSGPRHYVPVDSEPEESVHHIHHHYKPRPTQRPVRAETYRPTETYRHTDKGFLGHGKEFDKLTGAALIVGGTGILGGILGQQLGGK